jgi:hypothetical protein
LAKTPEAAQPTGRTVRLSGMRRLIATAFAATALVAALSGCGSQTDDPAGSGGPATQIVQQAPATLTVATSLSTDGPMHYTEGALVHMVLRDADGNIADGGTKWPGKRFVFDGLDPGTYVLEPALRPCDGNCGYLDPPTDSCRDTLTIDGDLSVRVEFTVGDPCVVGTAMRG